MELNKIENTNLDQCIGTIILDIDINLLENVIE